MEYLSPNSLLNSNTKSLVSDFRITGDYRVLKVSGDIPKDSKLLI